MKTLTEVAEAMLLGKAMKEPEKFLVRQIKAGKIRGRKIGRTWMMTDADIEYALEKFSNTLTDPEPPAAAAPAGSPSVASMRRRRRAA